MGILRNSDLVGTSDKTREYQWFGGRVSRVNIVRALSHVSPAAATVRIVGCVCVPRWFSGRPLPFSACPLGLKEAHWHVFVLLVCSRAAGKYFVF